MPVSGQPQQEDDFVLKSLQEMRRKLLDLTARNRLLNFPINQKLSSLRIINEQPNHLFLSLQQEQVMTFKAIPDPTNKQLHEQGYLGFDDHNQEVALKPFPDARAWATFLGINNEFVLPNPDLVSEMSDDDYTLVLQAKHIIEQHKESDSFNEFYTQSGIQPDSLLNALLILGYTDLNEFEHSCQAGEPLNERPLKKEFTDNQIQTLYFPQDLETVLKTMHVKAQTALEESGAGILYLALGFLEWYESDDAEKPRLAPLFTVPVVLDRGKLDVNEGLYKYSLRYTGEDILTNLSLREKLHSDFSIALPELDENSLPETYFEQVAAIIEKSKPRWSVKRYAALALLNFSKMIMYLDLDPSRWPQDERNITRHDVIKRLFTSANQSQQDITGQREVYKIDDEQTIHSHFPLIDNADSSQHSALIDAINGENLVIEGPPGTGKSQTITNLIAAAMLNGKRILFVAEKMAALEVVKERLDKAGLGDFCLELHSHKSHKRKVLEEIQQRLTNEKNYQPVAHLNAEITRYEELKAQLTRYAEEINQLWGVTGKTLHQIFVGATRYRNQLEKDAKAFYVEGVAGDKLDNITQLRLLDQVKAFQDAYHTLNEQMGENHNLFDHPWYGVNNADIQVFDTDAIVANLSLWQESLKALQDSLVHLGLLAKLPEDLLDSLSSIEQLVADSHLLPQLNEHICFNAILRMNRESFSQLDVVISEILRVQEGYKQLKEHVYATQLAVLETNVAEPKITDLPSELQANSQLTLQHLMDYVQNLAVSQETLENIKPHLQALKTALPAVISDKISFCQQGLLFVQEFIHHASTLPVELIPLRSDFFDNDELDSVLEQLQTHLDKLLPLHQQLNVVFQLDALPDSHTLALIESSLAEGGFFCWFKSGWRAARQQLKALAKSAALSFKQLHTALPLLIEYSQLIKLFEEQNFKRRLSHYYQGLQTDVSDLLTLRQWYKSIRKTYGVGFAAHAAIGNALLALNGETLKAIKQLQQQKLIESLDQIFTLLTDIATQIPGIRILQDKQTELLGEGGLLVDVKQQLNNALLPLQVWFNSPRLSLEQAMQYKELIEWMASKQQALVANPLLPCLFDNLFTLSFGADKNNNQALELINPTMQFARTLFSEVKSEDLVTAIVQLGSEAEYQALQAQLATLTECWQQQLSQLSVFANKTKLDIVQWKKTTHESLAQILMRNERALNQPRWLNGWVNFVRVLQGLQNAGLYNLGQAVMTGELAIEHSEAGLMLAIYDQLAREILAQRPHLAQISSHERQAIETQFRDYDKKLIQLQRQRIAAQIITRKVDAGVAGGRKADYTGLALIQHELGKKSRHIPIRQLLNRAGKALQQLKPCFMMGPMSAAHYLQPGDIEFDLIVMDEASQVKPEDALGVIARAKQVVVVGDPKQLPPTNFFERMDVEENDEESSAVSQTDSILDAALPLFPMRRLSWHYRSQHESLIAYSNRHFYDNDLVVFPSPYANSDRFGVKFTFVEQGCFSQQQNPQEAKVVVEAIAHHAIHYPNESLGVVAMSSKQRDQIERALANYCKANPDIIPAIEQLYNQHDELFIKNLENVQGDERDVIFISFTYGPTEVGGHVYQRFGPINSDVGWRRLNVLFTRSRKRMHVFSSMKSTDITVNATSKRGVQALQGFLQFAENGGKLDEQSRNTSKVVYNDFTASISDALNKAGFEIEPQVGVGGFYVDAAVKDPDNPGHYLMAIESDGPVYCGAKSTRDRDRLRKQVLERLGWQVKRVWSTEWYINPQAVIEPIIKQLESLKTVSTVDGD